MNKKEGQVVSCCVRRPTVMPSSCVIHFTSSQGRLTIDTVPSELYKMNNSTFNTYWINPNDNNHIITGGMRGVFESFDGGKIFDKTLNEITYSIKHDDNFLYVASSNGIYKRAFKL